VTIGSFSKKLQQKIDGPKFADPSIASPPSVLLFKTSMPMPMAQPQVRGRRLVRLSTFIYRVCLGYFYEGFLAIQRAVDLQIMYELGGTSAEQELNNTAVRLKSFPYPEYYNDVFIIVLQTQLPFLIMLSFIVTAPVICKDVVLEKEKKLKVLHR